MIYIYRTLWAVFYIPVFLTEYLAFFLGFITYPIVGIVYYIVKGTNDSMKYELGTIPIYIDKKYQQLGKFIEKQKWL